MLRCTFVLRDRWVQRCHGSQVFMNSSQTHSHADNMRVHVSTVRLYLLSLWGVLVFCWCHKTKHNFSHSNHDLSLLKGCGFSSESYQQFQSAAFNLFKKLSGVKLMSDTEGTLSTLYFSCFSDTVSQDLVKVDKWSPCSCNIFFFILQLCNRN